jgi:hypothetical protein
MSDFALANKMTENVKAIAHIKNIKYNKGDRLKLSLITLK